MGRRRLDFSTQEYATIDGFETYTDNLDAGEAIFDTWIDGWVNGNGSTVGYFDAPVRREDRRQQWQTIDAVGV